MALSGYADVCEWYDDATQSFRIEVVVTNRRWGKLFGYTGAFQVEWRQNVPAPPEVFPKRTEKRE